MKLQPLGSLVLLTAIALSSVSGCSKKTQAAPAPAAENASKGNAEALALAKAAPGKPGTSEACTSCENTPATCGSYATCESLAGNAPDGTPKSQLCKETLACIRDSGCANDGKPVLKFCYCGSANVADCQSGKADGPCKAVFERSLEEGGSATFAQIAGRIGNTSYGGGVAMKRIQCEQVFCRKQCF